MGQLINMITDFLHRIYDLLHLSLAVGNGQPGLHPVKSPNGYLLTDRPRSWFVNRHSPLGVRPLSQMQWYARLQRLTDRIEAVIPVVQVGDRRDPSSVTRAPIP